MAIDDELATGYLRRLGLEAEPPSKDAGRPWPCG